MQFQPTRPLRGATSVAGAAGPLYNDFNPRAPCGARPEKQLCRLLLLLFQPTRPLRGATRLDAIECRMLTFQPTRPLRGATSSDRPTQQPRDISTHAPLAGRDHSRMAAVRLLAAFQPTRPLRGATPSAMSRPRQCPYFNPRAPCGARRFTRHFGVSFQNISTHAPLAGRDDATLDTKMLHCISTHAPLAGRDEVVVVSSS